MAYSDHTFRVRTGSIGRGFAAMDPERQRETVTEPARGTIRVQARPTRLPQIDWMRAPTEPQGAAYEGSSSRRGG